MRRNAKRFPAAERRKQILETALDLFAQQGFKGTTTRQVAEHAHINEALIFRHFPHKEDLYWAVLDDECRADRRRRELANQLQAKGTDHHVFAAVANEILHRNMEDTTRSRLLLFSALENHRLSQRFFRTHVARYYEILANHIRKRIREGSFRRVDPLLAARGFLGMVTYHLLIQELFGGNRYQKLATYSVGAALADLWLRGMRAPNGQRTRTARGGKIT